MSIAGLGTSAAALRSFLVRQDLTADNLANVATPGFKRTLGSGLVDDAQGPLETATNAFDLAVQGEGLFKVETPGGVRYTRAGVFGLDSNRELVTPQGFRLSPSIQLPANAAGFAVRGDGQVLALMPDGTQAAVGQVTLSRFPVPGALLREGGGVLAAHPSAGVPQDGIPGSAGFGVLATGALEGSNVGLAREVVDSVVNLRSFQVNARAFRAQDEMLGTLLDIRR